MRYVVCVKLTPDTEELADIQLQDVGQELGVTMGLNPWDEFAVEEALLLQERFDGDVTALTLGGDEAAEALKRAVAMGAGDATLLSDPTFGGGDAWSDAHVLASAIRGLGDVGLILTGRQAIDGNSGLVGAGIAAQLGAPFLSNVAKILDLTETHVTVLRTLDEGRQTVRVTLPAVIAVSKEINEPRYPTIIGIRKASRMAYAPVGAAAIAGLDSAALGAAGASVIWQSVRKPPLPAQGCEFIPGTPAEQAAALVAKLSAEKVI